MESKVPREGPLQGYMDILHEVSSLKHHIGIPKEKWSFAVSAHEVLLCMYVVKKNVMEAGETFIHHYHSA